ncbi:MAG TPA: magnesium/cobalt transporter CorA [Beijerinckiaceae bacterium]
MLRVYVRQNDHLSPIELDVTADKQPPLPAGAVPWLDLVNPTTDEDRYVERVMGVSIPTREEMQEIEMSSRLYSEDGGEFMTIAAVTQLDTDEPQITPITFVLKGQTLVTVRYAEPRPFMMFIARAQRPGTPGCATGEQIMLSLLEALIDRLADALERVGVKIDAISREVFHRATPGVAARSRDFQGVLVNIGREGDLLSRVRESLVSMTRVLAYHTALTEDADKRAIKDTRQRIRSIQRDISSLTDHSTYLSSKVTFLLDATLGLINLEQNQIIKIFSIAAVCLMPPTLIASIYGMNFRHMPELEWVFGYPYALGLMVVMGLLPFFYFRRKGWL